MPIYCERDFISIVRIIKTFMPFQYEPSKSVFQSWWRKQVNVDSGSSAGWARGSDDPRRAAFQRHLVWSYDGSRHFHHFLGPLLTFFLFDLSKTVTKPVSKPVSKSSFNNQFQNSSKMFLLSSSEVRGGIQQLATQASHLDKWWILALWPDNNFLPDATTMYGLFPRASS